MVVNMYKHMGKVVIKILQGSAVALTTLGGLTIHPLVANFLRYSCAKNCENCLAVDKVIAKIIRLTFFGPPCICRKTTKVTLLFQLRLDRIITVVWANEITSFTYLL